jgi:hypothetical protein
LTAASGPIEWQGEHNRLNTASPLAASCAALDPVETASAIAAITQYFITRAVLITFSLVVRFRTRLGTWGFSKKREANAPPPPVRMASRPGTVNRLRRQFVSVRRRTFVRGLARFHPVMAL